MQCRKSLQTIWWKKNRLPTLQLLHLVSHPEWDTHRPVTPVAREPRGAQVFNLSPRNVATERRSNLIPGRLWNKTWISPLPYSQVSVIKGECRFYFYSSELNFSAMKILTSKYSSSLNDGHLSECTRVGITKYTTHYKTAEEMQYQVSHSTLFAQATYPS